jgi:hypothetical protein
MRGRPTAPSLLLISPNVNAHGPDVKPGAPWSPFGARHWCSRPKALGPHNFRRCTTKRLVLEVFGCACKLFGVLRLKVGATRRDRTGDLLITNQPLYQLS